jgi:DNA polymerase-3 subunit delta'
VLDFLRVAYAAGRSAEQAMRLQDLTEEIARMGRQRVKALLALLLSWLRDLLLYRTLAGSGSEAEAGSLLVNVDQAEAAGRFVANLPRADLEGMTALVEEARYLVERNVGLPLLLTVLANALRQAMQGRAPESLYVPLSEPVAAYSGA